MEKRMDGGLTNLTRGNAKKDDSGYRVFSHYYGASKEKGIGTQAQSAGLDDLQLGFNLKELSSLHELPEPGKEMKALSYLLTDNKYTILGNSFLDSSNGYSRSAPCGLQFIIGNKDINKIQNSFRKILESVHFSQAKVTDNQLREIPTIESGSSSYPHFEGDRLAKLIDGFAKIVSSENHNQVLLFCIPEENSFTGDVYARFAVAKAMECLPSSLRNSIHFFSGLPAIEHETDPVVCFDRAVRYGANVVFCPSCFIRQIMSYRECILLDMDQECSIGKYAIYMAQGDSTNKLHVINKRLNIPDNSSEVSYDALNKAAVQLPNPTPNKRKPQREKGTVFVIILCAVSMLVVAYAFYLTNPFNWGFIDRMKRPAAPPAEIHETNPSESNSVSVDYPKEVRWVWTNEANTPIYNKDSKDSGVVTNIAEKECRLSVKDTVEDQEGIIWYYVEYNQYDGYVNSECIHLL